MTRALGTLFHKMSNNLITIRQYELSRRVSSLLKANFALSAQKNVIEISSLTIFYMSASAILLHQIFLPTATDSGGSRKFWWGGIWSTKPQKFGCLHQNWEWIFGRTRKFKRFFRPNSGGLQKKKKKKVFTKIESDFSAEIVTFRLV